jgi:hypothetical protein
VPAHCQSKSVRMVPARAMWWSLCSRASFARTSRIYCEPLMRSRSNSARLAVMVRTSVPVEMPRSKVSPFWASTALIVGGEDMVLVAI